jgi:hypothetical protein
MILFNKKSGFTLLEVLFYATVIAIALAPIIIFQADLFQQDMNISKRIARIFEAKDFLYEMIFSSDTDKESKTRQLLDEKSSLEFQRFAAERLDTHLKIPDLFVDMVTISWYENAQEKKDYLFAITYDTEQSK